MTVEELKAKIREIPDFPKKGILFYDITTLIRDGKYFKEAIDMMCQQYKGQKIDGILAIEARGLIIGSAMAYRLGCGVIPMRKKGKLPFRTIVATYELEYGTDEAEIHEDAISKGENILIVDDLLATGGTASAAVQLVEKAGGNPLGCCFLVELTNLKGREKLFPVPVFSLIQYEE